MCCLVYASPPKPLEVKTSSFTDALVLDQERVFAMVYHRLQSSCVCFFVVEAF